MFYYSLTKKKYVTILQHYSERIDCVEIFHDLVISAIKAVLRHPRHLLLGNSVHGFTPRAVAGGYVQSRRIVRRSFRGWTHIHRRSRFFGADGLDHTLFGKPPRTSMARILSSTAITQTVKNFLLFTFTML